MKWITILMALAVGVSAQAQSSLLGTGGDGTSTSGGGSAQSVRFASEKAAFIAVQRQQRATAVQRAQDEHNWKDIDDNFYNSAHAFRILQGLNYNFQQPQLRNLNRERAEDFIFNMKLKPEAEDGDYKVEFVNTLGLDELGNPLTFWSEVETKTLLVARDQVKAYRDMPVEVRWGTSMHEAMRMAGFNDAINNVPYSGSGELTSVFESMLDGDLRFELSDAVRPLAAQSAKVCVHRPKDSNTAAWALTKKLDDLEWSVGALKRHADVISALGNLENELSRANECDGYVRPEKSSQRETSSSSGTVPSYKKKDK